MFHGFIVLLTSGTLAMTPKSACKLHPTDATKMTHVFTCPEVKHLRKTHHSQSNHIPVDKVKTSGGHMEVVPVQEEGLHGIILDSLHHLVGGGLRYI
jgi:hypothetical protein